MSPIDGSVLIDALCQIYSDPHIKLHGAASVTLLRMIQTSMSFSSTKETALNIPLFYYVAGELKNLCARPNYVERLGGISGIEILVENLPKNFLFGNYSTLLNACLSVLQYGDDDISLMSQETAINVYRKILDLTISSSPNKEIRRKTLLYLIEFTVKNWKCSSNWVADMLTEILWTLRVQKDIKRSELFSGNQVDELLKWHFEEFPISSLEFKLSQLVGFDYISQLFIYYYRKSLTPSFVVLINRSFSQTQEQNISLCFFSLTFIRMKSFLLLRIMKKFLFIPLREPILCIPPYC